MLSETSFKEQNSREKKDLLIGELPSAKVRVFFSTEISTFPYVKKDMESQQEETISHCFLPSTHKTSELERVRCLALSLWQDQWLYIPINSSSPSYIWIKYSLLLSFIKLVPTTAFIQNHKYFGWVLSRQ